MKTFLKDPDAILKYTRDWSKYLGTDAIASSIWVLESGITNDSDTNNSTTATITLSGGTAGTEYTITNRITTTTSGETDDRSFIVRVEER